MEEKIKELIKDYLTDNLQIEVEFFTDIHGLSESKRAEVTIKLDNDTINTNSFYL